MGLPFTGAFARANQVPLEYTGAAKWGNGVNPIHQYYGGPGRYTVGRSVIPNELDQRTPPAEAASDETAPDWGVIPDDFAGLDVVANEDYATIGVPYYSDDWPSWTEGIEDGTRAQVTPHWPSWGHSGAFVRSRIQGPYEPDMYNKSWQTPGETVSEGWINKATGAVSYSHPSADSQIFVQTSDVQRFRELDNNRAQMRGTDGPRTSVPSRVAGKIVKMYSGEERHYDMFPRQLDDMPRPFWYRTAGTGPNTYLSTNDFRLVSPLQRTPAPDPSMGIVDSTLGNTEDYGYTDDDWSY